ncbi:MAG: hypothetical protein ACFFG0_10665 [Candidatus Thorarchaeota archaeon]
MPKEDKYVKVNWDKMKDDLIAFGDAINEYHKVSDYGGEVKPFVTLIKFAIVIPIKRPNPQFSEAAFTIAKDLGIGIAHDKSGVIIRVEGKDWNKSLIKAKKLYLTWRHEVNLHKRKILQKVQATS